MSKCELYRCTHLYIALSLSLWKLSVDPEPELERTFAAPMHCWTQHKPHILLQIHYDHRLRGVHLTSSSSSVARRHQVVYCTRDLAWTGRYITDSYKLSMAALRANCEHTFS